MKNIRIALMTVAVAGLMASSGPSFAHDPSDASNEARVRRGFDIAPVPLNLKGKDRELVGIGSYLVNGVASCNDCHSADPATEFAPGGNPYFKGSPPTVVNQATYLGGGRNFGSLIPGTPIIVSRNLTPDGWRGVFDYCVIATANRRRGCPPRVG